MELGKKELLEVYGGAGVTAALWNGLARTISTIIDVGRSFGSAIRRLYSGIVCPL